MSTVAVVGLGTAGAAVAATCSWRGLNVVGLERGPLGEAGARWVNGVPAWTFRAARLPVPVAPERRGGHAPFHLVAGWDGPERVTLQGGLEVDMRLLVQRLQETARRGGARLHGQVTVHSFDGRALETSLGRIEADVFVDASGHGGARLLDQPRVAPEDLCAAAQEVREVTDPEGARAFFVRHGARLGELVVFTGIAGGYSILNVHGDGETVSLLTGSIPALGHPSGRRVLEDFAAAQPWIGPRIFGGSRAIPLRRAWPRVGRGRVALVGDAACQVYPAHGSGIGQQLLAARLLADTLAEGGGVRAYNLAWQRRHGGLVAGSDVFRRFSQGIGVEDLRALIRHRVLAAPLMADALAQRPPRPPLRAALRSGLGLAGLPRLARRLGPVLARVDLVERHYRRYPEDPADLPAWVRRLERLSGVSE